MRLKKIPTSLISAISSIDQNIKVSFTCASDIPGASLFMEQNQVNSFREKLEQHYAWPALYIFKFIVPTGKEEEVKKLFPKHTTTEKLSKNGKYISITIQMMMPSSNSVIAVYQEAASIDGLIAF